MHLRTWLSLAVTVLVVGACMGTEDERTPVGPGSPAARYCARLGYASQLAKGDGGESGRCVFGADAGGCDDWAFYQGQCGTQYSYCATHGGAIATTVFDAGTWVGTKAVCTVNGVSCDEEAFSQSGHCP